jgi:alpha-N-arabinofuranosidase
MANIAQTINVLQAMILTQGEEMLVTPTGYVYEMYAPHQGATAVRALVESARVSYDKDDGQGELPTVSGSASVSDQTLFLTLTNAHASEAAEVQVELLGGARADGASGRVLSGEIHAHNDFDAPDRVMPAPFTVTAEGAGWSVELPAASVCALEVSLV